ncbi:hypothetical protein SAMN03159422_03899 [Agrobacterium fabrum]|nr:hypothetical protein SAMN03159422_03899 [Agrobacterium fabrum]SER90459.1 hypothetical protein SAMN03159504_03970 [Agrobacterium fabrum]
MKTVREPCNVGPASCVFEGKFRGYVSDRRKIGVLRWRNDKPAQVTIAFQQAVSRGNIDKCCAVGEVRSCLKGKARGIFQCGSRCRRNDHLSGRLDEFHQPGRIRWCRHHSFGRHGQGVDADKPDTRRTKPVIAFNDRRDVQTRPSKPGICLGGNSAAVLCHQLIQLVLRQDRGRPVITCSGFGIDCLDGAPEAGCERDADNEGDKLKRSVAPV